MPQFITSDGERFTLMLADPISGLLFGLGNSEEEAISDAVANSYYFADASIRVLPCSDEWVRAQIRDGGLTFSTADQSERETDDDGNVVI